MPKSGDQEGATRPARALTARALDALKPEEKAYRVPDARCPGLAARVAIGGRISWDCAFRIKGKTGRRLSLGAYPDVTLEEARERANKLTKAGRRGVDLIAEEAAARAEEAARISVEALIARYVKAKVKGKLRTATEIESRLIRALAGLLEKPALSIRRRDLREAFDAPAEAGLLREAEKRRQTVGAMFRWALSQDLIEIDPTAGLTAYDGGTPRDRILSAEEIRSLWTWLDGSDFPLDHAEVLRLQLCTGARCGEVAGIEAAEIDEDAWVWTLPASRSKNGRARVTPIVGLASGIIAARLRIVSRGPLFASATGMPLKSAHVGQAIIARYKRKNRKNRSLPIAGFGTHDLRRTVASGLAEMGISLDLIAAIVGHEAGGRDTRTLVRHYIKTDAIDRKRLALEAWDERLRAIIAGEQPAGNVIDIRAASA